MPASKNMAKVSVKTQKVRRKKLSTKAMPPSGCGWLQKSTKIIKKHLSEGIGLLCLVEKLWWLEKTLFYLYFLLDFFQWQCNACAHYCSHVG